MPPTKSLMLKLPDLCLRISTQVSKARLCGQFVLFVAKNFRSDLIEVICDRSMDQSPSMSMLRSCASLYLVSIPRRTRHPESVRISIR